MPIKEDRYKQMIENSPDLFWEFDENANFTYVSPRIRDLLGYEPEELVGKNAFDLMDSQEADRVYRHFDPIAKNISLLNT
jgi:PAS domain S-box-containing protein